MPPVGGSGSALVGVVKRRRAVLVDLVVGILIFGAVWSFYPSRANPFRKDWSGSTFFERYYGAVVLSICQGRWQSPEAGYSKALDDFLTQKRDRIECADLPPDLPVSAKLNYQAVNYYYLFKTVEMTWRLRGEISWKGLDGLLGFLCAAVSVCSYLIFRFGMGSLPAIGATAVYLPAHIVWVSHLRDYGKAPFFLVVFWCLGSLVSRRDLSRRRLLLTAAVMGVVVGLGMGFRPDIMIVFPAVVLTIAVFLPWHWRSGWQMRGLTAGLFVLTVWLAYWPAARWEKRVYATTHVTLLGLGDRFEADLGIEGALYHWTHIFSDPWVVFQVKSFSRYALDRDEIVPIYSEEYNRLGGALLWDIARRHPADLLIRAYAATGQLLYIPWAFIGLLALVVAKAPRRGLFLATMVLYFTAYTSIQFHPRHYFQVEWIPVWLIGFGLQAGLVSLSGWLRRLRRAGEEGLGFQWQRPDPVRLRRAVVFLVAVPLALGAPLVLLRVYQTGAVERWLSGFERVELAPVDMRFEPLNAGEVRLVPSGVLERLPTLAAYHYDVGYLAVDLDPERCGTASLRVTVRYEPGAYHDFSHVLEATDGVAHRIFVPIYSRVRASYGDSVFLGLDMDRSAVECVEVQKLSELDALPPVYRVDLPRDWHQRRLYLRYAGPPGFAGLRSWLSRAAIRLKRMAKGLRAEAGLAFGTARTAQLN